MQKKMSNTNNTKNQIDTLIQKIRTVQSNLRRNNRKTKPNLNKLQSVFQDYAKLRSRRFSTIR